MADREFSRSRPACLHVDPTDARWEGLRFHLREPHERRGPLRLDDRTAVRDRLRPPRAQRAESRTDDRAFSLAAFQSGTTKPILKVECMSADRALLTIVTLGVDDLARGIRFYETLGFARRARGSGNGIAFFAAGGTALALYPWDLLAEDASVPAGPRPPAFRGSAL